MEMREGKFMMNLKGTISALLVLAFIAAPVAVTADQLALPLDQAVQAGTTTIQYAGQSLTFTTSAPLRVQLSMLTLTEIELRFIEYPPGGGRSGSSASGETMQVVWDGHGTTIYSGGVPSSQWEEYVLTESGWAEK
jgi:hypothetical protein